MKQVWITRVGPPEVLVLQECADVIPRGGQVRIHVEACGVNFADLLLRQGSYPNGPPLPVVPGFEVAGVIDALGESATCFKPGDRVTAYTPSGGYCDSLVVPEENCYRIPDSVGYFESLTIPVNYNTAFALLHEMARIRSGEFVLVYAAAGGVGIAACDLILDAGATPIGIASASKHPLLHDRGVKFTLDLEKDDLEKSVHEMTAGAGVDVILDSYGGDYWFRNQKLLAKMGRLLVFGYSSTLQKPLGQTRSSTMPWEVGNPLALMASNTGILGVDLNSLWNQPQLLKKWADKNNELLLAGRIRPLVDRSFPLEDAASAHQFLHSRKNIGKVVLVPNRS